MRWFTLALIVTLALLAGASQRAPAAGEFNASAPALPADRECVVSPEVERAATRGLEFLAKTQKPDGSWADNQYGNVPGVVGLAVMAFLAHGEVPDEGRYGQAIRKAVDFIIKQQQANGLLSGGGSPMYSHGFATLALAEVYGVIDDPRVGPALKKAVGLIVTSQNRQGGWRYDVSSQDSDTTVSGAQMMALRAAANAGIEVPLDTIKRGVAYFKSTYCAGGGFGYTGADGPSPARAGIGMLILCLSGEYRSAEVKATADWISNNAGMGRDSYVYYASYYCSQAMYQAGGSYWRAWNNAQTPAVIAAQQSDGSWSNGSCGTTCDTAMALLSIEINYNLLPIYQR
ncbi:MAG: terpene cyclase/mutase family protein [Phycisphaerae bacterium]|nr:terpene cyclase/mutase family protein [Phycisphaerae bacterium]